MLLLHLFQYHVDVLNEVLISYYIYLVVSYLVLFDYVGSNFGSQSYDWSFQAKEGAKCVKDSK